MNKSKNVLQEIVLLVGLCLFAVLTPSFASAVTYYVSSSDGDDNWSGKYSAPTTVGCATDGPWKTIKKVNTQSFSPGDVIKFNKGDIWTIGFYADEPLTIPTSGTASSRITFTNYGSGALPLFCGSKELVNNSFYTWTKSNRGTNEYYCYASNKGWNYMANVVLVEAHSSHDNNILLWKADEWCSNTNNNALCAGPHQIGSLKDHDFAWGKNAADGLTYDTLYIRDDSGKPGLTNGFDSVSASISDSLIVINNKNYIDIQGIETTNAGGISIRILNNSSNNRIIDCVCNFNHDGIDAWAPADQTWGGNNEISRCVCSYNYRHGIMSTSGTRGFSNIANNTCSYNNMFGIWIAQRYGSCIIEYNECAYNGQDKTQEWGYWGIEVVQDAERQPSPAGFHTIRYNKCYNQVKPPSKYTDSGGISIRADNAEVYYNLCYRNDGPGIGFGTMNDPNGYGPGVPEGSHTGAKIFNNVCYYNVQKDPTNGTNSAQYGEFMSDSYCYNATLRNNIIVRDPNGFADYILQIGKTTGMDINYNCYYDSSGAYNFKWGILTYNSFSGWKAYTGQDGYSLAQDPKLTSDYHIQSSSPCINEGTAVNSYLRNFPSKDYWGKTVPYSGGAWDIGANEYQGVVNHAPIAGYITISPNPVTHGQTFSFSATGCSDPDGDTLTYWWGWQNPGSSTVTWWQGVQSYTNQTAPSTLGVHTIHCLVADPYGAQSAEITKTLTVQ